MGKHGMTAVAFFLVAAGVATTWTGATGMPGSYYFAFLVIVMGLFFTGQDPDGWK